MSDTVEKTIEEILTKVEESKVEETKTDITEAVKEVILTEVMIDITKITFSQMLENFLNQNKDKLDSLSIKISPEMHKYFLLLCKEKGDFFTDVDSSLKKIILDDKIDTKDIPEIIILVTKVYEIIKSDKGFPKVDPYELIKTLLNMVFTLYIETNKVQNKELATDLLKIIDVSIDLIKLKAIKPPTIGCLSKLFK